MTIETFARRVGVNSAAIHKAIKSGRLAASVGEANGRPIITDPALGEREWRENRDPTRAPDFTLSPLVAARRRLITAQAVHRETRNQREQGTLVDADARQREFIAFIVDCRHELESLPGQIAGALHGLTVEQLETVEAIVRAKLTRLADAGVAPRPDGSPLNGDHP